MPNRRDHLLRPMTEADLDAVLDVQAACYPPGMREPADVVLARLRSAPATTLVACDARGVCAYVFAYPSRLGRITPLNAGFLPAPNADTLYVHDLAVAPRAHGRGQGRRLAQALFALARGAGLRHGALVAVLDARPFWAHLGFSPGGAGQVAPESTGPLASYPEGALYMVCRLDD